VGDVRAEVAEGRQAYVVCPLIEESEKLEVASAEETFERCSTVSCTGCASACCTGGSAAEKETT
jgi:ATP-dependent DNA helicase RecG